MMSPYMEDWNDRESLLLQCSDTVLHARPEFLGILAVLPYVTADDRAGKCDFYAICNPLSIFCKVDVGLGLHPSLLFQCMLCGPTLQKMDICLTLLAIGYLVDFP